MEKGDEYEAKRRRKIFLQIVSKIHTSGEMVFHVLYHWRCARISGSCVTTILYIFLTYGGIGLLHALSVPV